MALNLKNAEVERLVTEIARLTGETKTEAVRRALEERRRRLAYRTEPQDTAKRGRRFLEEDVWPLVPEDELGRRLTRAEEDAILGYADTGA
ncbi:MAG: type II toxin-antitoxin system VapB family antitoxin [Candidatus Dormibacteraeota bacterium]|nr:type II toxin-antitoxin system VapB family antitoxin [Candidatus Dormibacteraeota bacterium]